MFDAIIENDRQPPRADDRGGLDIPRRARDDRRNYARRLAGALWWLSPAAREKPGGRVWCFGASLSRLLPGIELNKEFADFFNDPDRVRLKFWPSMLFSALRPDHRLKPSIAGL